MARRFHLGALLWAVGLLTAVPAAAETETRVKLELYNAAYRGRGSTWYYAGSGLADVRIASVGNRNMRAEAALGFLSSYRPGDGPTTRPELALKRLWFKANFPSWRLTAGKTKVAWGNGFVFNSGDILFESLTPFLDFTRSTLRDDTAFLTAFNIPLGRFSYVEGVVLPPRLVYNSRTRTLEVQPLDRISGGARFFIRAGGVGLEGGYLYKGDAKVSNDLLGHRPYLSFHGHAGVDLYGSVSLAAGYDWGLRGSDKRRDTWNEIAPTVNFSFGAFHQVQAGYDGTLSFRLEVLIMPWQNWGPRNLEEILDGSAGRYGIMIYPEIRWAFGSAWTMSLQSVISPVDASAQITAGVGWNIFQGFTLLGFFTSNAGDEQSLFAWDRSGAWPFDTQAKEWPAYSFNGINITMGARCSY